MAQTAKALRASTPDSPPRWTGRPNPPVLGVVMIVRNEEDNLPALFASLAQLADELVVVDTGSTDSTVEICKAWGATVVHEPWRDDFARARNRGIAAARATHLLWVDADDRLPARSQGELARLRDGRLAAGERRAFQLRVQSVDAEGQVFGQTGGSFQQTRIFPRLPGVEFRNPVHEELTSGLETAGVPLEVTDLVVEHVGYADPQVRRAKAQRNLRLLQAHLEQSPDSVSVLLHLAMTHKALGQGEEALRVLSGALRRLEASGSQSRLEAELCVHRSSYRLELGDWAGAAADLERAICCWQEWRVPLVALAGLRLDEGDLLAAAELLRLAREAVFQPGVLGAPEAVTERNLHLFSAAVLRSRGENADAAACLERALEVDADDFDVRMQLGQTLLDLERFGRARIVLESAVESDAPPERFVEIAAAIALARGGSGDLDGAGSCLAPLLDVFSEVLDNRDDVGLIELAEAMHRTGYGRAAGNLLALLPHTLAAA